MTIKARVIGAFTLVLTLLLALGINSLLAIHSVDREARRVEAGVQSGADRIEALVQLRSTLTRARRRSVGDLGPALPRVARSVRR